MPYLYLHLREGEDLVEDLQGANYCDLAAAELAALTGLWDIAGESIKSGQPIKSSAIVIVDAQGSILATVTLPDAMKSRLGT